MTLAPAGLAGGGGVPATVRLAVRGAEQVSPEFRPLTTELAGEGDGCGRGHRCIAVASDEGLKHLVMLDAPTERGGGWMDGYMNGQKDG